MNLEPPTPQETLAAVKVVRAVYVKAFGPSSGRREWDVIAHFIADHERCAEDRGRYVADIEEYEDELRELGG